MGILNLSASYLENYLSYELESWSADKGWWEDYLWNYNTANLAIFGDKKMMGA